jgi:hypothetical protein
MENEAQNMICRCVCVLVRVWASLSFASVMYCTASRSSSCVGLAVESRQQQNKELQHGKLFEFRPKCDTLLTE